MYSIFTNAELIKYNSMGAAQLLCMKNLGVDNSIV